jgi:acetoin utilization deacetylase AcuC-like enzyme
MSEIFLFSDERMEAHDPGRAHPERPDRLRVVREALAARPVVGARWLTPKPATREEIERIHTTTYVDSVTAVHGMRADLDPDTHVSPGSVTAAFLAAGAGIEAVTAVMKGSADAAFAVVRPPGHHAEPDRAMGFCLFNNVAVAAAHARTKLGAERVMIIDWDVHHGNGTEHAFSGRRDVVVANTHQFPHYPGTGHGGDVGEGEGRGFTVNVPLPGGLGDGDYVAAFERLLVPIADRFRPDLVLVSAGFDPHRDDPLGDMNVTEEGFARLASIVQGIARAHAGGRLAMFLEGGYDLPALGASVRAVISVLAGETPAAAPAPSARGEAAIAEARLVQSRHWPV